MQFREYQPGDLEAIYRLDLTCFKGSFQFDRRTMKEAAESPSAIVVIHDDLAGGGIPAFVIVHLEGTLPDRYAYIITIDVAPGCRRLGIGAALLVQAEFEASKAGAARIGLHVATDNAGAIAFYERQHYRRTGVARRFYEAGLDAFVYNKGLSPAC